MMQSSCFLSSLICVCVSEWHTHVLSLCVCGFAGVMPAAPTFTPWDGVRITDDLSQHLRVSLVCLSFIPPLSDTHRSSVYMDSFSTASIKLF